MKKLLLAFFSLMLVSCATTKTFEISSSSFHDDYLEITSDTNIKKIETTSDTNIRKIETTSNTNIRKIEVTSKPDTDLIALNFLYTPVITIGYFTRELFIATAAAAEDFIGYDSWLDKNKKRIEEINSALFVLENSQKSTDYYKYKDYIKPFCQAKIVIDDNYNQRTNYNKINNSVNVLETRTIEVKKDIKVSKEITKLKSERFARYISYGTGLTLKIIFYALPIALICCGFFGVFG